MYAYRIINNNPKYILSTLWYDSYLIEDIEPLQKYKSSKFIYMCTK